MEKKLDGNYTRMLRAILNKSWRQHPTKQQLYSHQPPITKTIKVRQTRHAGHYWRSRDELISDVLLLAPSHGRANERRSARTYIQQLCADTGCSPEDLPEAMDEGGERGSRLSVLREQRDDNDSVEPCSFTWIKSNYSKWAAVGIGLFVNAHKTEYMCYNQTGDIFTLDGTPLKLVDKFSYLGNSVASTEKDIDTRLTKAWTAINRLSIIWKSDLTDKMKRSFFQAAVTSILLNGCTTWTLTKRLEKKLDGNHTTMLRAILNKSWRQHTTRHQLYGHLPPITKTIQVRRTRQQDTAGEAGKNS